MSDNSQPEAQLEVEHGRGRKGPQWTTVGAVGCLVLAGALAIWGFDRTGDDPQLEPGDFEVEVREIAAIPGIEYVERCADDGFFARISSNRDHDVDLDVRVDFVAAGGEVLQVARLPFVVVPAGESTMAELIYDRERTAARYRDTAPACLVTFTER